MTILLYNIIYGHLHNNIKYVFLFVNFEIIFACRLSVDSLKEIRHQMKKYYYFLED